MMFCAVLGMAFCARTSNAPNDKQRMLIATKDRVSLFLIMSFTSTSIALNESIILADTHKNAIGDANDRAAAQVWIEIDLRPESWLLHRIESLIELLPEVFVVDGLLVLSYRD